MLSLEYIFQLGMFEAKYYQLLTIWMTWIIILAYVKWDSLSIMICLFEEGACFPSTFVTWNDI